MKEVDQDLTLHLQPRVIGCLNPVPDVFEEGYSSSRRTHTDSAWRMEACWMGMSKNGEYDFHIRSNDHRMYVPYIELHGDDE